jgi:hypothetical protein
MGQGGGEGDGMSEKILPLVAMSAILAIGLAAVGSGVVAAIYGEQAAKDFSSTVLGILFLVVSIVLPILAIREIMKDRP